MPQPKRGLGKGLGALIPTAYMGALEAAHRPGGQVPGLGARLGDVGGAYFDELPLAAITPNPRQPRQIFDEETLAELAASIRAVGLLQPVVVREIAAGRYELVMGERR